MSRASPRAAPAAARSGPRVGVGRERSASRGGDRHPVRQCGDGGTGKPFDWTLVARIPDLAAAFLAGGIGPRNARAAQRARRLWDRRRLGDRGSARAASSRRRSRPCSPRFGPLPEELRACA